jgi:hypothetical protein
LAGEPRRSLPIRHVAPADVAGAAACAVCSKPGTDYSLRLLAFYLDFSIDLDVSPHP